MRSLLSIANVVASIGGREMRLLYLLGAVLMLTACNQGEGRYQLVAGENSAIFRMDTKTGEIDICGFNEKQQRIVCAPSPRLINSQPSAPTSKPGMYEGLQVVPDSPKKQ